MFSHQLGETIPGTMTDVSSVDDFAKFASNASKSGGKRVLLVSVAGVGIGTGDSEREGNADDGDCGGGESTIGLAAERRGEGFLGTAEWDVPASDDTDLTV